MANQIRSAELLVQKAISSPQLMQDLQSNPEATLRQLGKDVVDSYPRALEQDKWVYRIVVGSLSLVLLIVVVGVIYLTVKATGTAPTIPDVLTALGSAAIGALAGLLAPSPGEKGN